MRRIAILPLFFLSGVTALGLEVVLARWLRLALGAGQVSTAITLIALTIGLTIGSALAERSMDRVERPLQWYAICEGIIGLYSVSFPWMFRVLSEATKHGGWWPRVLVMIAWVLVPFIAMGATLPLLTEATNATRTEYQRVVRALYTTNIAGGVLGSVGVGFVVLPRWGLTSACYVLSGLAALVVTLALISGRLSTLRVESIRADTPSEQVQHDTWALVVLCLLGTSSFVLQVTWNRILGLLLASSVYTFSVVTAMILLGLGWGSLRTKIPTNRDQWSLATRLCLLFSVVTYLGILLVYVAPYYLASASRNSAGWALLARLLVIASIVLVPMYCVGSLFPLLGSMAPRGSNARAVGIASVVVSLGNALGATLATFVLIPKLGMQSTLIVSASLGLVGSCISAYRTSKTRLYGVLLSMPFALGFAWILLPRWNHVALSAGSFRVAVYQRNQTITRPGTEQECGPDVRLSNTQLRYHREGNVGTVSVFEHRINNNCALLSLRVDGKSEGSVFVRSATVPRNVWHSPMYSTGDLPTEIMAGWLPTVLSPPARRALLIGWGTGFSVRSMLESSSDLLHIDAVEIESAVYEAAQMFDAESLVHPRVARIVADGRMVLAMSHGQSWDLIVSHPSNPWVIGAASLFSLEYFQLARERLTERGRMLAWVQLYEIDALSVKSLVRTFATVFPRSLAFRLSDRSKDLILLGFNQTFPVSCTELPSRITLSDGALTVLQRAGFQDTRELSARCVGNGERLLQWSQGAPFVTDDNASLEFSAAGALLQGRDYSAEQLLQGL